MPTEHSEGLPRRFLPAFLLLSLDREGTSYGYELYETVRSLGLSVDLAAVYRSLRTMQQRDLVTSAWGCLRQRARPAPLLCHRFGASCGCGRSRRTGLGP